MVRLLLSKGINPDVEGKNSLTALHVATHYNHVTIALYLLEKRASPHCATKVKLNSTLMFKYCQDCLILGSTYGEFFVQLSYCIYTQCKSEAKTMQMQ